MRVLLFNARSSSLKATLVEAGGGRVRSDAGVARPGSRVRVLVIAARGDVTMLREVMQVVGTPGPAGAPR